MYVQIIVVFAVIGRPTELDAVIVPAQLSVAVGGINEVSAQDELIAGKLVRFGTGATLSPA